MDEYSLKVGLALRADLTRIQSHAGETNMTFAHKMVRYCDVGLLHQDLEAHKEITSPTVKTPSPSKAMDKKFV